MALSVTAQHISVPSGIRMATGLITFDSSYAAGGEPVTAAQLGGNGVDAPKSLPDFVVFTSVSKGGGAGTTVAPNYAYDKVNGLIHVYGGAVSGVLGITETTAATDLTTAQATFLAIWVTADPSGTTTL